MKRILTLTAAALIAAPAAFAETHTDMGGEEMQNEQMTMLMQQLQTALSECTFELSEEETMNLTMAQVSGIVLASNSTAAAERCQQIEAIAR